MWTWYPINISIYHFQQSIFLIGGFIWTLCLKIEIWLIKAMMNTENGNIWILSILKIITKGRAGGVRKPQILLKIITKGRAGGSENPKSWLRNTWMVHPTNRVFNCLICLIWFIKKGKVNPWVNGQNVSSKATCNNCRYN